MEQQIQDVELLRTLCARGRAAHQRMAAARDAEHATRLAADAARLELYDAQREFESANHYIRAAGFHDTGHLRTILERIP